MKRFLFWAPRALAIAFAFFISLFALDVFGMSDNALETLVALLIHLIPTYAILIALIIAWRREWAGALLFAALAAAYPLVFGTRFPWSVYVVMMGPPLLIGVLFLAAWMQKRREQAAAL